MVGGRSWKKQRSHWMTVWPAVAASPPLRVSSSHSRATRSSLKCWKTTRWRQIHVLECLWNIVSGHDCFCSLLNMIVTMLVSLYSSVHHFDALPGEWDRKGGGGVGVTTVQSLPGSTLWPQQHWDRQKAHIFLQKPWWVQIFVCKNIFLSVIQHSEIGT